MRRPVDGVTDSLVRCVTGGVMRRAMTCVARTVSRAPMRRTLRGTMHRRSMGRRMSRMAHGSVRRGWMASAAATGMSICGECRHGGQPRRHDQNKQSVHGFSFPAPHKTVM